MNAHTKVKAFFHSRVARLFISHFSLRNRLEKPRQRYILSVHIRPRALNPLWLCELCKNKARGGGSGAEIKNT